ncbi:MAG TPA: cytidine deaminase [Anaerolineae bacterium]|nr:cytidine deaminase [Anaerolineae bacterium]
MMTNEELIQRAASVIAPRKTRNGLFADVGCALLSVENKVYLGVCAASGSNVLCAEQNAIGSMITDSVYRIAKIVAVWKDDQGAVHVISPCGNCRQMMFEMDKQNLQAEIILDHDRTATLEALLPYHDWWKKQG